MKKVRIRPVSNKELFLAATRATIGAGLFISITYLMIVISCGLWG